MKSLKKLIGTVIGGIGALVGTSLMLSGCDEGADQVVAYYGPLPAVDCCVSTLKLKDSDLDYCMEQYSKINKCDAAQLTRVAVYYGPAYDLADLKACCGEDETAQGYNECFEDFRKNPQTCNKPVPGAD